MKLESMKAKLQTEVADAEKWFRDNIDRDEKAWIATGKDVESLFDAKYRELPNDRVELASVTSRTSAIWIIAPLIAVALLLALAARTFLVGSGQNVPE